MGSKKLANAEALRALRDKAKADLEVRSGPKDVAITVHMGTCGIASGARDILAQLVDELPDSAADSVCLRQTGCAGLCDQEPMMTVSDQAGNEVRYGNLDKAKVHEIVHEHVLGGTPVQSYIIRS